MRDRGSLNLVVENGRPPAIPRIDRRIDLYRQEIRSPVGVLLGLHPRHNTHAHRDVVPPGRVPDHGHGVLELGDPAKRQRGRALPEGGVVGREERQVAFMSDGNHARSVPILGASSWSRPVLNACDFAWATGLGRGGGRGRGGRGPHLFGSPCLRTVTWHWSATQCALVRMRLPSMMKPDPVDSLCCFVCLWEGQNEE